VAERGLRIWAACEPTLAAPPPAHEAARFVEVLNEHLAAEEELVVPLMERHITAAEWHAVVEEGAAAGDPAALPITFGMLCYEGDSEVVERVLGRLPAGMRHAVRCHAATAYSQYARRVHCTATPLRSTEL
jgi:hypothetical protein